MFDEIDDTVLLEIHRGKSIQEIGAIVGRADSSIHKRLLKLEKYGLLAQKVKGQHRARSLTAAGKNYLKENGLLKNEI